MTWLEYVKEIWDTMIEEIHRRDTMMYYHEPFYRH
jgi:hypothetical protein